MKSRKKRETEGSEMNGAANEENKDDDQDEDRIGKAYTCLLYTSPSPRD